MQKPKPLHTRRYWEALSDQQLVETELETDDPESLDGLATEIPPGDDETYVEFRYDLTGSGREEFVCVHGHHRHLKGFVMRKGSVRFLVGWMCGESIYGEAFDDYKADFSAAVNRQVSLRRRREIGLHIGPFMAWMEQTSKSDVFRLYASVRRQIAGRMPWIWDNVNRAGFAGMRFQRVSFPPSLFDQRTDPEREFGKITGELSAMASQLIGQNEIEEKTVDSVRRMLRLIIQRIEVVLDQLKEVEDFFQPGVLSAVCELGNEYDNPKKRKYITGLTSITCKREKDREKVTVVMPMNYRVPNRAGVDELKRAIEVM